MARNRSTLSSIALCLVLLLFALFQCEAKTKKPLYQTHKNLCQGLPKIQRKHESDLKHLFKSFGESKITGKTPQNEAACWMFRQGRSFNSQRFALAVVYYSSKGATWDSNTNWMTPKHECSWYGVTCDLFRKVIELDLGYIELEGLVPRELGLLDGVRDLDLHGNDLQGVLPHKLLTGMRKAQYLRLQMNGLFGSIHKEITRMSNLKELYLFGNFFCGYHPKAAV